MKKQLLTFLFAVPTLAHADPLVDWFALSAKERNAVPASWNSKKLNSEDSIQKTRTLVWEAYRQAAIKNAWDKAFPKNPGDLMSWVKDKKLTYKTADLGEKKMPYIIIANGEKPAGGWPIFFCLHGGGGNANAPGPHSWQVNTSEWRAQMSLSTRVWKSPGLYIIPRMADDREGRWYYGYNQVFLDRAIQQAILFNEANPNKIYLMGISEGGYTAFRLGSMMADRWAGACAMAAAEPLGNAPPENLQHVAFRCGIGEKDTMFNRIGLARTYFKQLGQWKQKFPKDFTFHFDEQKGRGHGIDYQPGPAWIAQHTRNPIPKNFHWTVIKQHDRHRNRLYWLALDAAPEKLPLKLTAHAGEGNKIQITALDKDGKKASGVSLRIYLSSDLVEMKKPVTININDGQAKFEGVAVPTAEAIIRSTAERGDPTQVFPAHIRMKF